jgi:hypothetical protein
MDLEPARLHQALMDLGRSLAGFADPDSVLQELYRILRTVIPFDHLALLFYDGPRESPHIHAVKGDGPSTDLGFLMSGVRESTGAWAYDHAWLGGVAEVTWGTAPGP